MSPVTKRYRTLYWTMEILSMLVTLVPVLVYLVAAFVEGTPAQKLTLGATFTVAVVLTFLNVVLKYRIRSTLWILLIGIYVCMRDVLPLIWILAVGTVLDEFMLTPLAKRFKAKYTINGEIDKRL